MEFLDKIYLGNPEFADFYEFISKMKKSSYLRLSQVVRVHLDITSKRAYLTRIEGLNPYWVWFSEDYQDDGPYIVYRDSLESILDMLTWYE